MRSFTRILTSTHTCMVSEGLKQFHRIQMQQPFHFLRKNHQLRGGFIANTCSEKAFGIL